MRLPNLGYAVTAYRAQGITTDTSHTLIATPEMTREALYVAMSRGRHANHTYIATDQEHLEAHQHRTDLAMTARSILFGILQHEGAPTSATETRAEEKQRWESLAQIAAEYDTISAHATHHHWQRILYEAGLTNRQLDDLTESDSYGILTTELRRLAATGHDTTSLLNSIIRAGRLDTVEDLGSILHYRLTRLATYYQPTHATTKGLIGGLIPTTKNTSDPEMARALQQREALMKTRIAALIRRTQENPPPWAQPLSLTPASVNGLAVILTYRDLWNITTPDQPLGPEPESDRQKVDYHKAERALHTMTATPSVSAPHQQETRETTRRSL